MSPVTELVIILLLFVIAWLLRRKIFIYPLLFLTTIFHESGHALASILVGRKVDHIVVRKDLSGITNSFATVDEPVARKVLVTNAGFLASIFFGFLIFCLPYGRAAQYSLFFVGSLVLLITTAWVRGNISGFIFSVAIGICLILLGWYLPDKAEAFITKFIGICCVSYSLLRIDGCIADAQNLREVTRLPVIFWVGIWYFVSLGFFALILKVALEGKIL